MAQVGSRLAAAAAAKQQQQQQQQVAAAAQAAQQAQAAQAAAQLGSLTGAAAAAGDDQTVIPNLATYVHINGGLQLFAAQPQLKRVVPVAIDRAIRDIITPVVERSVTISCVTTRELMLKVTTIPLPSSSPPPPPPPPRMGFA